MARTGGPRTATMERILWTFVLLVLSACRASPARREQDPAPARTRPVERAPEAPVPAKTREATGPAAPATAAEDPGGPAPLEAVEFVTAGADPQAPLPLVIAVHGLGDRPERFARALRSLDVPVRVVAPRAPTPWHDGGSWFPVRARSEDRAALAEGVAAAEARLAAFIRRTKATRPTVGEPIVTGFSQGGILSFAVAALHPDLVSAAVPVSGLLPEPLYPKRPPSNPPVVVALHGTKDPAVAFARAKASIAHLAAMGYDARLVPFEGVGHAVVPAMHRAWKQALARLVRLPAP